jgi:hypothetical protein
VGVLADVEVDLRDRIEADQLVGVDQQGDVDAVAGDERQLLQEIAARGDLTGERLAHCRELGVEGLQQRARGQLGDAAAAVPQGRVADPKGAAVEALDELGFVSAHERPEQAAGEVRAELLGVGVEKADNIPTQDPQRAPHRVALAEHRSQLRRQLVLVVDLRAEAPGDLGGSVGRAVDHDELVDDALRLQRQQVLEDRADRLGLIPGGQADADRRRPLGCQPGRFELPVVVRPDRHALHRMPSRSVRGSLRAFRCASRLVIPFTRR